MLAKKISLMNFTKVDQDEAAIMTRTMTTISVESHKVNFLFLVVILPNMYYLGGVIESTISNIIPTPAGVTMKVISSKTD